MNDLFEINQDYVNLLNKILNYENEIFNKFIHNRTNLIKNIKSLNVNNLNVNNLNQFINDLKSIIDPIKTSNEFMDIYFNNFKNDFKIDNSTKENNFVLFYFLFKDFFLQSSSELSSDDSELSSSELSSPELSSSELSSSESV